MNFDTDPFYEGIEYSELSVPIDRLTKYLSKRELDILDECPDNKKAACVTFHCVGYKKISTWKNKRTIIIKVIDGPFEMRKKDKYGLFMTQWVMCKGDWLTENNDIKTIVDKIDELPIYAFRICEKRAGKVMQGKTARKGLMKYGNILGKTFMIGLVYVDGITIHKVEQIV